MKNLTIYSKSKIEDCRYKSVFTKLKSGFRKIFFSHRISLEEWEQLEAKKQISTNKNPTSVYEKMVF